jgi:hypothetical protein
LTRWGAGRTDLVVYDVAIPGCPISRGGTRRFGNGKEFPVQDECGWWDDPDDPRTTRLFEFDPDIVLVEDALNEILDRKQPSWPDWRHVGDPRFDAWLLGEYRAAAEVFAAEGAMVVYANGPCADWARIPNWSSIDHAEDRIETLNRIYENVVGATTKVADLFERVCPGGAYTDEVEGVEEGRPDGFHFADEAANRLAGRWLAPFFVEVERSRPPHL